MTDADTLTKQIDKYVSQLREVGWCVVEGVIPVMKWRRFDSM